MSVCAARRIALCTDSLPSLLPLSSIAAPLALFLSQQPHIVKNTHTRTHTDTHTQTHTYSHTHTHNALSASPLSLALHALSFTPPPSLPNETHSAASVSPLARRLFRRCYSCAARAGADGRRVAGAASVPLRCTRKAHRARGRAAAERAEAPPERCRHSSGQRRWAAPGKVRRG